ncbi:MAG: septum formation protein Maf [Chloroflexi bacterium]|nr:septum formation protein Maf [Chloroflexota bacterium]
MTPLLPWVLASGSPRRRAFVALLGLAHEAVSVNLPEVPLPHEPPRQTVVRLALSKALAAAADFPGRLVVGSDTLVALDGEPLGKPAGPEDAREMLLRLRDRPHQVMSGVALVDGRAGQAAVDYALSLVWMRPYSDDEVQAYVASGDPLDKAGAYAVQHQEFRPASRLEGCYASVMGLPLCHLGRAARSLGLPFPDDVPSRCRADTGHPCQVYPRILAGGPLGRVGLPLDLAGFPWQRLFVP